MKSLVFALFVAPVLAGSALAQSLIYEFGDPIVEATTEINQSGDLDLFDSDLGVLTGATLVLRGSGTSSMSLTSSAATTVNARMNVETLLMFTSSLGTVNALVSNPSNDLSLVYTSGTNSYTPGQTRDFGPLTYSDEIIIDLSSLLADLQVSGGGTFSIGGTSLSSQSVIGGGGNISTSYTTTAGIGARIEYTYTAIPEPGTFALAVLPLLALASRRRR